MGVLAVLRRSGLGSITPQKLTRSARVDRTQIVPFFVEIALGFLVLSNKKINRKRVSAFS